MIGKINTLPRPFDKVIITGSILHFSTRTAVGWNHKVMNINFVGLVAPSRRRERRICDIFTTTRQPKLAISWKAYRHFLVAIAPKFRLIRGVIGEHQWLVDGNHVATAVFDAGKALPTVGASIPIVITAKTHIAESIV